MSKIMTIKTLRYIIIFILFYTNHEVLGQNILERGAPFIKNYSPKEYGYGSQTWAVAKDNRGIMYFGCNEGIIEFDGVRWRLIETELKSHVRSLASDRSGVIYVGASDDFGYLGIDKFGNRRYYSLKEKVNSDQREFSDVWSVLTTTQGVYFFTIEKIFRWHNDTITTIPVKTELFSSVVRDRIYVFLAGGGIGIINGDKINILPHTKNIGKGANGLIKILPFLNNRLLIITDLNTKKGVSEFFVYNLDLLSEKTKDANISSSILKPFKTEVDSFINQNYLYDAEKIDEKQYALGTTNGGIVIINDKGSLIRVINSKRGLQNNSVHDLFIDENKNIWACLNRGISFIDINSGISLYNEYYGLKEMVVSIFEFKNNIYLGSFDGIYNFSKDSLILNNDYHTLNRIDNYGAYCFDMIDLYGNLFAAGNSGILRIANGKAHLEVKIPRLICFGQLPEMKNRLFMGLYPGFAYVDYSIKKTGDENKHPVYEVNFSNINMIDEVYESVIKMVPDKNGDMWLLTSNSGLIRIQFDKNDIKKYSIDRYNAESGLPELSNMQLFNIKNELIACSNNGIYRIAYDSADTNNKKIRFEKDTSFGSYFNNNITDVSYILPDNNKIWIGSSEKGIGFLQKSQDGSWKYIDKPFKKISTNGLNTMYLDSKGVLWISTNDAVVRINTKSVHASDKEFNTIIRKVTAGDSVLFNGTFYDVKSRDSNHYVKSTCLQPPILKYNLDYTYNSLKFDYAATFFENADKNKYEYFLEGFDNAWSSPTQKTEKEYTNLPEGDYCFRVKSTNVYKSTSTEGSFCFTILPPWYRTIGAYISYIVLSVILIVIIVRIYSARLKKLNKRLEEIIRNRTAEIQKQKDELQLANATKDKFFGIIAHDLRNPFNNLLGFSQLVMSKIEKKDCETALEFANLIHESSQNAYELLENLLTWSRSQSGRVTFNPEKLNIRELINSTIQLLMEHANKKGISLSSTLNKDIFVYLDKNMILTVLRNLITNALKFSNADDMVTISVEESESEITVHCIDTGVGMEEHVISRLFKIGESVKTEGTSYEKGTGLGLLLCKEFIDWHKGKLWVKSKKDVGSTFSFTIPIIKYD